MSHDQDSHSEEGAVEADEKNPWCLWRAQTRLRLRGFPSLFLCFG